jgi:hypothetical protein
MPEPRLSPDFSIYALTPEQLERRQRVKAAARAAFGDDHELTCWIYRQSSEFGWWESPENVAARSNADLERVLDRIRGLASTTTPKWRPVVKGRSPRRR